MGLFLRLILYVFMISGIASESRLFKGRLNSKGRVIINYALPKTKPFIIQGYILFEKNWRGIQFFWDEKRIWTDLGPIYRNKKYRVHVYIP